MLYSGFPQVRTWVYLPNSVKHQPSSLRFAGPPGSESVWLS